MGMESMNDNQELHSNNEKDGLELGDALLQEIPEDQEIT